MSAKTLPAAPYAGLRPYSEDDAPFFFGRERVKQIIIDNLKAKRLTLVYGASGVGKSSVLRAGVQYQLHSLSQENLELKGTPQFAVAVFQEWREWKDDPISGLRDCVQRSVRRTLGDPTVEMPPGSGSLAESFQHLARLVGGDLLIILDQFEDYFFHPRPENGEGSFLYEFQRLVNRPDLRVNFLLSIREDAYSKLEQFKDDISNIFDNSLEIGHLDIEAAREAIIRPIEQYNRFYAAGSEHIVIEPELVEEVLSQVRTGRLSMAEGPPGALTGNSRVTETANTIETPFLQLVMSALWKAEMSKGSTSLTRQTLDDLKGAQKIVKTHLEQALEKMSESEKALAAGAFGYLVTPSGDKRAYTAFDISEAAELNEEQLTDLLEKLSRGNNRILRSFASPDRRHESSYEIFHDVLADPILVWRRRYRQDQRIKEERRKAEEKLTETKRRAEEEKKLAEASARADEQTKVAAVLRLKNRALALATAAAVIAAFIAAWQYMRAEAARHQAVVAGNVHSDVLARLYRAVIPGEQQAAQRALLQIVNSLSEQGKEYRQDNNPTGEGITLNNIGGIYRELGRSNNGAQEYAKALDYYQQADDSYEEARAVLERALGPNHPDVATSLHDRAYVDMLVGKYAEAEPLFKRALSILEGALGSNSTYVADVVVNLAHCYNLQGKYNEAELLYKRALKIRRKELRPDHPKLAESLYYLGSIYFAQGKYASAESLFNDSLAIWKEDRESPRSKAAPSFYGLAAIYREQHKYSEATDYLDQGRLAQESLFDQDNLLEARYADNLALLYDAQNKPETETFLLQAYQIKQNALGADHPDTAYSASRLASFYQKRGNYGKAEEHFNEALKVQQALGASPDLARTLCSLARVYTAQSKHAEAEPLLKQALAIQEKSIPRHPDLADTLDAYAELLDKTDRKSAADQMKGRADQIREAHSKENPDN